MAHAGGVWSAAMITEEEDDGRRQAKSRLGGKMLALILTRGAGHCWADPVPAAWAVSAWRAVRALISWSCGVRARRAAVASGPSQSWCCMQIVACRSPSGAAGPVCVRAANYIRPCSLAV